ncbi:MAG: nucleoside triphosphate pyrophosphohydrolase [Candidatus Sumerlaeaceae bacterium]|nr:nucleoside triphosphate pyrophosphohydrolase [Candidatus Sumerlaeaceae bacterium]
MLLTMAYEEISDPFQRLVRIMTRLQEPGGCPWDLEQTHESLKPYMIEECYEALDAIDREDYTDLTEELGDVLLQVLFHSVLAARFGRFQIDDVINTAANKMVGRHPHVFGDVEARTAGEVLQNWERLKAAERAGKGTDNTKTEAPPSILSGVPTALPALLKAQRIQEKAARVGFEWENPFQVLDKVEEEVKELRAALANNDSVHAREEIGDLIFSIANLARFLKIDAEESVRQTGEKFRQRFQHIEKRVHELGQNLQDMSLDELMGLWVEAKERTTG